MDINFLAKKNLIVTNYFFSIKKLGRLFSVFVVLWFNSCQQEKFEGYSSTESGLYYKLYSLGNVENYPKVGDLLTVNVVFKTEKNVVIHQSLKKIELSSSLYPGSLEEGLLMLSVGDSASFKILADSFYLKGINKPLPQYISKGSYITVGIKITDIRQLNDDVVLNHAFIDELAYKDLEELRLVANYIKENHIQVQPTLSGLYILKEKETQGKSPMQGHGVKIHYTGSFLDGRIFDSTLEREAAFDFILGVKDQVIPGIEQTLYLMHEGEKVKVIIPSFLAFGEKGSSTGIVPPFTPVMYEIELLQEN